MIKPEATVNRLLDILERNEFVTGTAIDFFDA